MRPLVFVALAGLAIVGCSHRVPVATVELIDASLSITPQAQEATTDAVRTEIGRMERGDILILIPITGDEENDAGGRILRLTAPHVREAYDADMRRFRSAADAQFAEWLAKPESDRGRTDILGSLDLARQELEAIPSTDRRRLVVLSDFLEDDGQYRFASDPSLMSRDRARALAERLRTERGFDIRGVMLCLGRLQSTDFPSLLPQRKIALQSFWAAYLGIRTKAAIQIDPTNMLDGSDTGCFRAQR